MKKITFILMSLLLLCTSTVKAAIKTDGTYYRLKEKTSGLYMNIWSHTKSDGNPNSYGGFNIAQLNDSSEDQMFQFEQSGNGFKIKSKSGSYMHLYSWNVCADVTSVNDASVVYAIEMNTNEYQLNRTSATYPSGKNFFKVGEADKVNDGVKYLYCDAPSNLAATWILEEVSNEETVEPDWAKFDSYMDLSSKYLSASAQNTIGYPVVESDEYNALNTVHNDIFVNKGYSNKDTYEYNQEDYDAIVDAYNNYIACSNVALPQNGKAYKIVNVQNGDNGNKEFYLDCTATGALSFKYPANEEDVFICRVVDDNFVFVNKYGQYLTLKGSAENDYTGNANLTLSRLDLEGVDDNLTFTYLTISGYYNGLLYYLRASSKGLISKGMSTPSFSINYSGAFKFIEVEYPNNVKLNAYSENDLISNIPGATIGTFSAPFPTVIPNDVTAYYASSVGERVTLTKVEGAGAIPANQGVILIGATGEVKNALMIPAANEERASISEANNFFAHTAGETKTMNENGTDYILTKADGVIGFYPAKGTLGMNKAYLANVSDGFSAVRMVVDETTAIEGVSAEKVDAPIYDLTGRRVLNTAKGGVYIQNGKKFIVK